MNQYGIDTNAIPYGIKRSRHQHLHR